MLRTYQTYSDSTHLVNVAINHDHVAKADAPVVSKTAYTGGEGEWSVRLRITFSYGESLDLVFVSPVQADRTEAGVIDYAGSVWESFLAGRQQTFYDR